MKDMESKPRKTKKIKLVVDSIWLFLGDGHKPDDVYKIIDIDKDSLIIAMGSDGIWRGPVTLFEKEFAWIT